jgi:hypothetical protein
LKKIKQNKVGIACGTVGKVLVVLSADCLWYCRQSACGSVGRLLVLLSADCLWYRRQIACVTVGTLLVILSADCLWYCRQIACGTAGRLLISIKKYILIILFLININYKLSFLHACIHQIIY